MKLCLKLRLLLLASFGAATVAHAQGTAFSYQGRLNGDGAPTTGLFDLRFTAYNSPLAPGVAGGPITLPAVLVTNGLFAVTLDFGAGVFTGPPRWLEIAVRTNGAASFVVLEPRQLVTAVPYATHADTASNVLGSVVTSLNNLRDNVTLAAGTNVTLTPNGNTLTFAAAGAGGSGIWSVDNNNAYYTAGNVGIGTSTPTDRLTIAGVPSYHNGLKLTGSSAGGTGMTLENTSSGGRRYNLLSGGDFNGVGAGGFGIYDETVGDYRLAIGANGNVGIGTPTPVARLYVVSQTAAALDNTATFYAPAIGPDASHVHYGTTGDWFIRSANSGGKVVLQDYGGNVGIGSATPNHRLRVSGGPGWTANGWAGALELDNAAAIGWRANAAGNHFGLGQSIGGLYFFHSTSQPGTVNSAANYLMILNDNGRLGLGTLTPATKLTVNAVTYGIEHTDGSVRLGTYLGNGAGWLGTLSNHRLQFFVNDGGASMTIDTAGNVGIGTTGPGTKLDVAGDVSATRLVLRADPLATANAAVLCTDPGVLNFVPYNTANARPLNLVVRDATVRQLTITGGADLAEPFKMSSEEIPKGSVVVIDEENPGHLKLSTAAYDTRVAGVVSGANGVRPGISLHQEGEIEGGENVALSGRVYVHADATHGAIKPGDLLTTSVTPGHAMKVGDHAKAQGAILGKAMSRLDEGKGMVLVLVTLQ